MPSSHNPSPCPAQGIAERQTRTGFRIAITRVLSTTLSTFLLAACGNSGEVPRAPADIDRSAALVSESGLHAAGCAFAVDDARTLVCAPTNDRWAYYQQTVAIVRYLLALKERTKLGEVSDETKFGLVERSVSVRGAILKRSVREMGELVSLPQAVSTYAELETSVFYEFGELALHHSVLFSGSPEAFAHVLDVRQIEPAHRVVEEIEKQIESFTERLGRGETPRMEESDRERLTELGSRVKKLKQALEQASGRES